MQTQKHPVERFTLPPTILAPPSDEDETKPYRETPSGRLVPNTPLPDRREPPDTSTLHPMSHVQRVQLLEFNDERQIAQPSIACEVSPLVVVSLIGVIIACIAVSIAG